jgi:para-nitrobenzyl esterase
MMSEPIVETQNGKIKGIEQGSIRVWKGIPFAQAPVGNLRFRPPQPAQPWSGVWEATTFSPTSMQIIPPALSGFGGEKPEPMSEDCLYLNVWSPAADDSKRPVMVWIHGGAFVTGSGSIASYSGASFAERHNIVVVTLNYRLGTLGFLHLGDLAGEEYADSGNCGILDQIAALQWVHNNIASFGGDPENVTVAGESAGAMSVGTLLAMPAAQGLFQRAILESGACHNVTPSEHATEVTQAMLQQLNIAPDQISGLLEVPAEQLLLAQEAIARRFPGLLYMPVINGNALPRHPSVLLKEGAARDIAILIGTNRDESRLFTLMAPDGPQVNEKRLQEFFGDAAQETLAIYTNDTESKTPSDAWSDILTDEMFRISVIRLAEMQVNQGAPVWMYRFDWPSPAFDGRLKACHALEIPFVFNTLHTPGLAMLTGDGPERQAIAERMHGAWAAFVRNGDPNGNNTPSWPQYDSTRRATYIFNVEDQVIDDPQGRERECWNGKME